MFVIGLSVVKNSHVRTSCKGTSERILAKSDFSAMNV